MPRKPEIGNVQLYPNRPLRDSDKNGYVLKFYCPIRGKRIRKNAGTRDRREARRILRECRERLLNGLYVKSGGAITEQRVATANAVYQVTRAEHGDDEKTWDECFEQYSANRKLRIRKKSQDNAFSRIKMSKRILDSYRDDAGLPEIASIRDYTTLDAMEYVQERLLAGDEGRYDYRAPMTVNTTMGAVMAFVRYCHKHEWIDKVPCVTKLDVEDVMKGRPITEDELNKMLEVTPLVVGEEPAESWQYVLRILWESAFRVGDLMDFSWDDTKCIHPIWPTRTKEHPTLAIPSTQKNKKVQEIPMLPGLQDLLEQTPRSKRHGWIVDPLSIDYRIKAKAKWFKPTPDDLAALAKKYNNRAVGRACGVTDTTVRKWLSNSGISRTKQFNRHEGEIDSNMIEEVRRRAQMLLNHAARRDMERLSKDRVSRIISMIGEKADIVVREADEENGRRIKYASAHDIRRGCAQRLINAGVSAETLKLLLRHRDFATTERFYGATRAAQSAADEIQVKLTNCSEHERWAQPERAPQLSGDELQKLKALLNSL